MRIIRAADHTHYDTLGVLPADSREVIAAAYEAIVRKELVDGWPLCSSMRFGQAANVIIQASEAFKVLCNGEYRARYNKELMARVIICSLCEGSGINKMDCYEMQKITCIACGGTGKSK